MTLLARSLALLCAALIAAPAHAALFWVGSDAGCTHATLQEAINAAQANGPGEDEIRVRGVIWLNQNLSIQDQSLIIDGGWNGCGSGAQRSNRSVLSAGASAGTYGTNPVMQIQVLGLAQSIRLRNLIIQDGFSQDTNGGGLRVEGRVSVVLENVALNHNYVWGSGGGMYVNGLGVATMATVELHQYVTVSNNRADTYGGGIYGRYANIHIRSDQTDIVGNNAGFGGGIAALQSTSIKVGAFGQPVPLLNATGARIRENVAVQGGGVYLASHASLDARELSIVSNVATSTSNAGGGGGIYAVGNAFVRMARDYPDANAVSCPADQNCSRIVGNRAGNGCPGSAGTGGGAYFDGATGFFHQVLFLENCAWGAPALQSWGPMLVLEGLVFARNRLSWRSGVNYTARDVVAHSSRAGDTTSFSDILFSTFADNVEVHPDSSTTPANAVTLLTSSIWNFDVVATAFADPLLAGGGIDAHGPCNRINLQAGNFINPAANDYRPTTAGFLVDACPLASAVFNYTDPYRVARCQNHSRPDQGGHCDVGAYELPSDIPADRIFANGFQ